MADLPEITEVQRLTVKPGDVLIVRVPEKIDTATADQLLDRLRSAVELPDGARVVVLDRGMSVEVVEGLG